jgi:TM2 domain-containing membrane protein YozV
MKSKGVAYLLWFFLGVFSAHRFYLKKYGTGIFYLLTFQLFGIVWVFDLFFLGGMVDRYNLTNGYYGPINGLNHGVSVKLNKGNQQPQPSLEKQPVAS